MQSDRHLLIKLDFTGSLYEGLCSLLVSLSFSLVRPLETALSLSPSLFVHQRALKDKVVYQLAHRCKLRYHSRVFNPLNTAAADHT